MVVGHEGVDEGLLAWDEPVWPHPAGIVDEPPEGFEAATVEQLLTHTGGLSTANGAAGTVRIRDGPDALDRRVAELLARPLSGKPGAAFEHSNAGPMLLAAVVEQVTGRSFDEELRERILDPLGMTGSFATGDDPRATDLATGHRRWFGRWRPAELPYDDAGAAMGYIGSTAEDLAAFLQGHLLGQPAIPATAAEIAEGLFPPTGRTTALDAGHEAQYDLGLGLAHLLLGADPQPHDPPVLLTHGVPAVGHTGARRWVRSLGLCARC